MANKQRSSGLLDSLGGEIDRFRTEAELDEVFDFSGSLGREDVEVTNRKGTPVVKTSGFLDDDAFGSFTEQAKDAPELGWNPTTKDNPVRTDRLSTPHPQEVHESRSEYAQKQDEARKARTTFDPGTYASDPNSFDYPFVDTPPAFEEEFTRESPGTEGVGIDAAKLQERESGGLIDF